MFIHNHIRALKSALSRLCETPQSSLLTVTVIAIALALPTSLKVTLQNIKTITPIVNQSRQITLYLAHKTTDSEAQELVLNLKNNSDIKSVHYISSRQGLKELQQTSGLSGALELLHDNPIPATIIVEPSAKLNTTYLITPLFNQLKTFTNVESATLDTQWLERLHSILQLTKYIEVILFTLFSLAVLIIIGNTINLNLQKSEQEIEILKLVGATRSFIRRQFLYQGFWYGLLGAIGTYLIITFVTLILNIPIRELASSYNSDFILHNLTANNIFALLVFGVLLGVGGATLAIHRNLK